MHGADRQLPLGNEIFVDHVAYFAPHMVEAERAMARLGLTLSPFTPQTSPRGPGEPPAPVGMANRCALLERGYIEILTTTGEARTPLVEQFEAAVGRHAGVHLLAFSCTDPHAHGARLAEAGFAPQPMVALQRTIETEHGPDLLRFSVLRIRPGLMPEGRIQMLAHHTPDLLWQRRWMHHPARLRALTDVALCVADVEEAAERFARFTGLAARSRGRGRVIETARGRVALLPPGAVPGAPDVRPPCFAAVGVETADLDFTLAHWKSTDIEPQIRADTWAVVGAGDALGTALAVLSPGRAPPWLL
ncbi:MAG: VOC family protein [Gammaproteobacteria bacterium]|nr:VOC family protein [Gammaproteobacteria bacterium]NIR84379.1 VOC family protein [Gammaproteobacteria bacterium]NIR90860.1 VOC family protein [Gammaproteobacteria bacterium]NIU07046.1 VOC family protein [Gammaproteobacteria bacterium]NIV76175.1 hypothetical protein [Gammaproteobacteria bacterium]